MLLVIICALPILALRGLLLIRKNKTWDEAIKLFLKKHILKKTTRTLKWLAIAVHLLLMAGCTLNKESAPPGETAVIDVYHPGQERIRIDDILVDFKVVPLEQNEHSLVGEVTKLVFAGNYIYLLDVRLSNVLQFDRQGNFVRSFVVSGDGPGECRGVNGLAYDDDANELLVACRGKRQILRFSLDGRYLGAIRFSMGIEKTAYLGQGKIAFTTGYYSENNKDLVIINRQGDILAEDFPYPADLATMLFGEMGLLTETDGGILRAVPLSANVYQLSENGSKYLKYRFDFGDWQWAEDKRFDFVAYLKHKIGSKSFLQSRIRENEAWLVFEYIDKRRLRVGFYHKPTGDLYTYDNLQTNNFVELLMRQGPVGVSPDGCFVCAVFPDFVKDILLKERKKEQPEIPAAIMARLWRADEQAENPVLLFYKLARQQ